MSYRSLKNKALYITIAILTAITIITSIIFITPTKEKAGAESIERATNITLEGWQYTENNNTYYYSNSINDQTTYRIILTTTSTSSATKFLYLFDTKGTFLSGGITTNVDIPFEVTNVSNIYSLECQFVNSSNRILLSYSIGDVDFILLCSEVRFTSIYLDNLQTMLVSMRENAQNQGYENGYNTGKQEGYDQGKTEGYEQGKTEGLNEGYKGIFSGATFDIDYTYNGTTYLHKTGLTPNFGYSAIYFHDIWSEIETDEQGRTLENCTLKVYLNPFFYNTNVQKFIQTGYPFENLMFKDQNGKTYETFFTSEVDNPLGYPLEVKINNQAVNYIDTAIIGFEIYIGRASDYLDAFQLLSTGGEYNSGYSTGYNDGLSSGKNQGYQNGLKDGEEIGYNNGYNAGYEKGSADAGNYTFLSLMTAVIDAPVKSFTGLLNFEILGFNVMGLITALLTVALILKIISTFSKGG